MTSLPSFQAGLRTRSLFRWNGRKKWIGCKYFLLLFPPSKFADADAPRSKTLSFTDLRHCPDPKVRTQDIVRCARFLFRTFKELATAIERKYVAFEVVNRKCGLASLPDDLLATISDYVVNKEENKYRALLRWMAAAISCLLALPQCLAVLTSTLDDLQSEQRNGRRQSSESTKYPSNNQHDNISRVGLRRLLLRSDLKCAVSYNLPASFTAVLSGYIMSPGSSEPLLTSHHLRDVQR